MNEINQTKEPEASYTLEASEPIITPIPSLSLEELVSMEISNPKIIIYKSKRKLYLYNNDEYLSSFDIGLGFSPVGAKTVQGDGKTPEGEYYICYKNPKSKFHLSIGLSYPNKSDAQRALDEGRISQKTYDKIASAIDNGKRPPWDTPLGGEIMIHGHGSQSDWTAGCIAVDDSIMDLLYKICDLGTPVIINE
ncbi:MAG: L,D-transpeptidase family protein [Eubacteriales bacterium]